MANTDEKNLSLLDSMASTVVSGSVGGYGAAFLTADQQARFAIVKTKLCGHKAMDLADLEKNGMGSLVEALQRLKWTKIATLSEIIVPRSTTFSSCTKADSDLMFWAIQNQEINTTELIIERMKFASSQVWDIKSKLNISLTYAHLLTRIFHHFGISVVGDVSEKMGQAIRSRNLRKRGFSVVNGVLSKIGAVEGEAQEDQDPAAAELAAAEEAASIRIEDIPPEDIEPIGQPLEDPLPFSQVDTLLRDALDSTSRGEPVASESQVAESVAVSHTEEEEQVSIQEDVVMENAPIEGEQSVAEEIHGEITVASGHTEVPLAETPVQEEVAAAAQSDVPMENVPVEEEFLGEKDGETQGEGNEHPPENQFRDGGTASSSDSEEDQDQQPPVDKAREKGKAATSKVPLIADTPFQRQMRQRFIINLKPVMERLDAQGEILCSVQSDVNSIFMSQASISKELSQVKNAVWWFNKEMGSMKSMLSEILKAVGAQAPPPPPPPTAQRSEEDVPRPSGPAEQVAGPSRPVAASSQAEVSESRPAGPVEQVQELAGPAEKVSGPSGSVESVSVQPIAEEAVVAPEPPAPSST
ncbi:hypothetical protein Taro_039938 [Colocasia esculenta]|uniref:Uncharacterized protein n=1 Tax=Colocasia esculenta TaxID=4460 RepID=A0A843WNQ5_COLES|nr:hypothetical protein [Colocasia esculenta]